MVFQKFFKNIFQNLFAFSALDSILDSRKEIVAMANEFVNIAVFPETRELIRSIHLKTREGKSQIVARAVESYAKKILKTVSAPDKR